MKPTERIIFELGHQKNPLGRPIKPEEVQELVEGLRTRFNCSSLELDLSPKSLKTLEQKQIEFKRSLDSEGNLLSDQELALFIRQVAAYIGEVLVRHMGGYWNPIDPTLFNASVIINGDWEITEDGEKFTTKSMAMVVGWWAASAWDDIIMNNRPNLYNKYKRETNKRVRDASR